MSAQHLVEELRGRGLTIATAESLTAGMIASSIADVPGASAVLRGGAVTYATETKRDVLDVDGELLAERGAVDPDVAAQMAVGAVRVFGSNIGVAATGVAGPTPQDGKDVGTVFLAVAFRESSESAPRCTVKGFHFAGSRDDIRVAATQSARDLVLEHVRTMGR